MKDRTATTRSAARRSLGRSCGATLVALSILSMCSASRAQEISQVTGAVGSDTAAGVQAESVCNVSTVAGISIESVVFNDDYFSPFVSSTQTDRIVNSGYSGVGWSVRARPPSNTFANANPPPWTHNLVPVPANWAALWGDPYLTSNPDSSNVVFLSTLAVPQDKFNVFTGSTPNNPLPIRGSVAGAVTDATQTPLGGACVARSLDGGQTFGLPACFRDQNNNGGWNDTLGHFYDGSSVAVTKNSNGSFSAFAGFIDISKSREAIWMMDDISSSAPNPFHPDTTRMGGLIGVGSLPGTLEDIETHVRLKAAPTGDLWKMSAAANNISDFLTVSGITTGFTTADLKINIRGRNAGPITLATDAVIAEAVNLGPVSLMGTTLTIRTGPQFDYDFGVNELGQPEMRFVYAAVNRGAQDFHLQAGFCTMTANPSCHLPVQWRTQAFNSARALFPAIKFGFTPNTNIPNWKVTFQGSDPNISTSEFAIFGTNLVGAILFFNALPMAPVALTPFQTPCPDLRSSSTSDAGYWGDYDTMTFDPNRGVFIRSFTDSSQGCVLRQVFRSQHAHVSTVEIPAIGGIAANAITSLCALFPAGKISCWGPNQSGQVGDGTTIDRLVSTPTEQLIPIVQPNAIASGGQFNCALGGGSVQCWGDNAAGEIGDGSTTNRLFPTNVMGVSGAIAVSAGERHACALQPTNPLTGGGTIQCWGENTNGQIGNGMTGAAVTTPATVQNVTNAAAVAAGAQHTCALVPSLLSSSINTSQCWGDNTFGQLGDGSLLVFENTISAGGNNTCVLSGGSVLCWGQGTRGELGDGTTPNARAAPGPVQGITSATAVSVGGDHTCALLSNGTVQCWGFNFYGQLGDSTRTDRATPVFVTAPPSLPGPNLSGVTSIAAGDAHTCALRSDQTVWCWGLGGFNGDGTPIDVFQNGVEPVPVQVR
jgi:alpha-tubulin suppressor-like RCC1 family protein